MKKNKCTRAVVFDVCVLVLNHFLKSACTQTRPLAVQPHFMILFVLVLDLSRIREEAERRKQEKQESTKEDNENEVKSGIIHIYKMVDSAVRLEVPKFSHTLEIHDELHW